MLDVPHFCLSSTPILISLMFCMNVLHLRLMLFAWLEPVFVMEEVSMFVYNSRVL